MNVQYISSMSAIVNTEYSVAAAGASCQVCGHTMTKSSDAQIDHVTVDGIAFYRSVTSPLVLVVCVALLTL